MKINLIYRVNNNFTRLPHFNSHNIYSIIVFKKNFKIIYK